jgi:hypothetical protein
MHITGAVKQLNNSIVLIARMNLFLRISIDTFLLVIEQLMQMLLLCILEMG